MEPGLFEVRNVTVSIHRPPSDVYAFVSDGKNVPRWAHGLGRSIRRDGRDWVAEGAIGSVRVRFAPPNELGVADHDVALENGVSVHNPMRVIPNGTGSSLIFTLVRRAGISDAEFARDEKAVERDLITLKSILESE